MLGLIQVARLENDVASYVSQTNRRPGTAPSSQPISDAQVTSLENEIRATGAPSEEVVQGQSSLLWATWLSAYKTDRPIPNITFEPVRTAADANSVWTKICVVKAVYFRGLFLARNGDRRPGEELHHSLLPWLDANRSLVVSTPQLLYWAQQLLARVALGQQPRTQETNSAAGHESASFRLQAYRHWAILAAKDQDVPPSRYGNGPGHLSKLEMWRTYYRFMSDILQNKDGVAQHVSLTRSELAVELRRVETSYENNILRNLQFPAATESNAVIEAWVEEFIRNWQILCGPAWSDSDLGEGGRNSCGRNVLDMLYRAATKSFHSTLILRRLFQVHKALTDFDLAYKALDTYVELMDRARARAAKSGGLETPATSRDSDQLFLETVAEGIEGLCSFGGKVEAEKAYQLCEKLEDLLDEMEPSEVSTSNGFAATNGHVNGDTSHPQPMPADLKDVAYRAMGLGKAHWARWTPFSETRASLQTDAIECLQTAASQNLPPHRHLKTLYALARLLAETRDIDPAIAVVKKALASKANDGAENSYAMQRQLMSFWHLLALLLTSRQHFETAGQSCIAAFEQFSPPEIIFGDFNKGGQRTKSPKTGLVDDMECGELQKIIEIRITELALTELMDGPDDAVNSSNDLLALYSRLFGRHGVIATGEETTRKKSIIPPKSAHGTVRSLPNKIFHRKRVGRSSESSKGVPIPSIAEEMRPGTRATQATQTTQAPTIHVTNEGDSPSPHKHKLFHLNDHSKEGSRRSSRGHNKDSGKRLSRSRSREKQPGTTEPSETPTEKFTPPQSHARLETIQSSDVPEEPVSGDHDMDTKAKQPLKEIPHNLESPEKVPPPAQHQDQPPEQDVRLPMVGPGTLSTDPVPRFPKTVSQRQALEILVKIWLMIATLYRRANMFEDSREACDEGAKVAMKIEGMIAGVESSARAFSDVGWGGSKSSDELWADVYCERAELLMAVARAREEKEEMVSSEGVREAVENYEQCLMYYANHAGGIVGLSNVLLDYSERKVELARRIDNGKAKAEELHQQQEESSRPKHKREWSRISAVPNGALVEMDGQGIPTLATLQSSAREEDLKKTPDNLNRLAARDRAYGLLSTLTKLGSGWDNAEAWFALARAHELGGELDKAKEILWWCVELEDTRPIRHWTNIGGGGYVL